MASLQMTKPSLQEPQNAPLPRANSTGCCTAGKAAEMGLRSPDKTLVTEQETEANWVVKKVQVENTQQFKPLEDDHIEQMIQELIHYGSIELCSVFPPQTL
jgi:hypothetical protein